MLNGASAPPNRAVLMSGRHETDLGHVGSRVRTMRNVDPNNGKLEVAQRANVTPG